MFAAHPLLAGMQEFFGGLRQHFPVVNVRLHNGMTTGNVEVEAICHPETPPHDRGYLRFRLQYSSLDEQRLIAARQPETDTQDLADSQIALSCIVTYHAPNVDDPHQAAERCGAQLMEIWTPLVQTVCTVDVIERRTVLSGERTRRDPRHEVTITMLGELGAQDIEAHAWRERGAQYRDLCDKLDGAAHADAQGS